MTRPPRGHGPLSFAAIAGALLSTGCTWMLPRPTEYQVTSNEIVVPHCGDPLVKSDQTIVEHGAVWSAGPEETPLHAGRIEVRGVTQFGKPCTYDVAFTGSRVVPMTEPTPTGTPYRVGESVHGDIQASAPGTRLETKTVRYVVQLAKYELVTFLMFGHAERVVLSRAGTTLANGNRITFLAPLDGAYELEITPFGEFDLTSFDGDRPPGLVPFDPWRHLHGMTLTWGAGVLAALPRPVSPGAGWTSARAGLGWGGTAGFDVAFHTRLPLYVPLVGFNFAIMGETNMQFTQANGATATGGALGALAMVPLPGLGADFGIDRWRLGGALRAAFHDSTFGAGRDAPSASALRLGWRAELLGCHKANEGFATCFGAFVTSDTPIGAPTLVELGGRAMAF